MMMRRLVHILMCAVAVWSFSSCEKEESFNYGDFRYDMVTYAGENGKSSVFTFQSYEDSPLVTLTANNLTKSGLKVGQRLFLNYIVDEDVNETTKVVDVKGFSKVTTDSIVFVPQEVLDTLTRDKMKVVSAWRTGEYLNIRCRLEYTEKPRRLFLATNGEIDTEGVINAYQIQNLMGAKTYYWLETYLSYYIGTAWNNENCKVLRYNAPDWSYTEGRFFDFKK